jgi:SAM-dependent methyltransferase
MDIYNNYDKNRFEFDKNRKIIWKEIARYLQRLIPNDSKILELGSGYCDFINLIEAKEKFCLDKYINPEKFANEEVTKIFGDFSLIKNKIKDNYLDIIFASNFFEHIKEEDFEKCLELIKNKLKPDGKLIIIQPNFRFCYKNYFDDYTHVKAWSDLSLKDYLVSKNFSIVICKPKFLPFSMKSKLPKNKILTRLYLNSPLKPFAGQMLIVAKKK